VLGILQDVTNRIGTLNFFYNLQAIYKNPFTENYTSPTSTRFKSSQSGGYRRLWFSVKWCCLVW
jgi:hypothetical protein